MYDMKRTILFLICLCLGVSLPVMAQSDVEVTDSTSVDWEGGQGGDIDVNEPAVTITAKSYTREYGVDNPTFEYIVQGATLYGVPEITCTATSASNVGSYDIVVSKGTVRNKNVSFVNGTLTVISKTVESPTITLSQTSYTYDGTAKKPTVTIMDGGAVIPATEYTVSYSNNINVGTATVTITDVAGGNYTVSGSTTFAIISSDGSLTPPTGKSNLVYNGKAQDLITAGSSTTGTMQYSLDGTTYSTTIPQGTNAGSYTVYYRVKGDANHNDIAAQSLSVGIARVTLSVSVGNYEITEGESIPEFTITYDGFVNNESVTVLTKTPRASCLATSESKPGEYPITISGGEATNYAFDYKSGTLTIKARETFLAGGDENKEEDDEATYMINKPEGGGDDTTPTVTIIDDTNVSGEFAIPETVEHNGTTYKVTIIGEGAFEGNTSLTKVTIPSSIIAIGDNAFKGCSNLESITTYNETPINLSGSASARAIMTRTGGSSVFDGVNKATCKLYVPEGSVELYKEAPVWSEFQIILAIGDTGIKGIIEDDKPQDIYDLQGRKVKTKASSFEGLPLGVYIMNGRKIILK